MTDLTSHPKVDEKHNIEGTNKPSVWVIAGSDCSGGAGIQADIKTMHNLGMSAGIDVCTVITAVTAQNRFGVNEINAMSDEVILSQLKALEQDKPAQVIKIGLLANKQQVELVAQQLSHFKSHWQNKPYVIYDPVAVASNGGNLTEDDILPLIKEQLLPWVDLITPNGQEVQKLTGVYAFSWDCLKTAAQKLLSLGVSACIIKGGHIDIADNKSVDFYSDCQHQQYWLSSERIKTKNSHGTGCTFASAIAALLAQGYLIRDAFVIAKAYINQGLNAVKDQQSYSAIWQGYWPEHIHDYPEVLVAGSDLATAIDWQASEQAFCSNFKTVNTDKLGLYPVIDSVKWLERLLKAGVKTIQYREKHLKGDALEESIKEAVNVGKTYQARLFINDHWQLAIKHNAYGVHLGQEDLESADLEHIKQAGLRLGISTHGVYELLKVKQYQPSYLAVGAIFPTKTKDMTGQIQGINTLARLVKLNPTIPMVAIGGITLEKAASVIDTNVDSIAVVTAITEAENPELAVEQFQQLFDS